MSNTATPIPRALQAKRQQLIDAAGQPPAPPAQVVGAPAPAPAPAPINMIPEPQGTPPGQHTQPPVQQQVPVQQPPQPSPDNVVDLTDFIVQDAPAASQPAATATPAAPQVPFDQIISDQPAPQGNREAAYAADMARLQGQVQAMQEMMRSGAIAPSTQQGAAAQAAQSMLGVSVADLTEEERSTYQGSIPVIQKLINQALANTVDPVLSQINARTVDPNVVQQLESSVTQGVQSTFSTTLGLAVPDLNEISARPEFATFLQRRAPYSPDNMRTVLNRAYKSRDVNTIRAVLDDFRTEMGTNPAPVPPAQAFQQPTYAPAQTPAPQNAQQKPTLKYSMRVKAGTDFRKGLITKEKLDQIDAIYNQALAEGRVDMNK